MVFSDSDTGFPSLSCISYAVCFEVGQNSLGKLYGSSLASEIKVFSEMGFSLVSKGVWYFSLLYFWWIKSLFGASLSITFSVSLYKLAASSSFIGSDSRRYAFWFYEIKWLVLTFVLFWYVIFDGDIWPLFTSLGALEFRPDSNYIEVLGLAIVLSGKNYFLELLIISRCSCKLLLSVAMIRFFLTWAAS